MKFIRFLIVIAIGISVGVTLELVAKVSLYLPLPAALSTYTTASNGSHGTGSAVQSEKKERKVLYWVAPMDPNYRRDKSGKSPMGMDLIPVYDDGGQDKDNAGPTVKISPVVEHNLGVRTAKVESGELNRHINAVGYIAFDEDRISHVHLRTEGWIERLAIKSEGERVKKGGLLFELYSPSLVNAQEEFVQALTSKHKGLIRASGARLRALGMGRSQVRRLRESKAVLQVVRTYASQTGMVSSLNVREGMHVKPATVVMSLVDLSSVWLLAEVFERQSAWVKVGQSVEARLSYLPGIIWQGRVDYIYPELDAVTRTLKVRLRFDNPGEKLKPNMYAMVVIYAQPKENALHIPREALIYSGHGSRVVVRIGEGRFQARDVVIGMESGDKMEIISGLEAGETVVTSAQFLLDSEASLKASFSRMTPMPSPDKPETAAATVAPAAAIAGVGIVNTVAAEEHKINVTHEPIDALGWPPMTMDFEVSDDVALAGLKTGDKISFLLKQTGEFSYQVTHIDLEHAEQHGTHPAAEQAPLIKGVGIVNSIAVQEHKINVTHEAIEALGWPPMTMDFSVADDIDLTVLQPDANIHFSLKKTGEFDYLVIQLQLQSAVGVGQ